MCNDPASHYIKRNIIRKAGNKIRDSLGACAVYQNRKKRKEKKERASHPSVIRNLSDYHRSIPLRRSTPWSGRQLTIAV